VVMVGDGDEMSFLATTGMERADVVVAVTGDDEDNLIACQLAKRKFKVPKTVARVNNPANVRIFKTLGVDRSLSATEVVLDLLGVLDLDLLLVLQAITCDRHLHSPLLPGRLKRSNGSTPFEYGSYSKKPAKTGPPGDLAGGAAQDDRGVVAAQPEGVGQRHL